jgi:hypothetical protein
MARIGACRSDLSRNGIDVDALRPGALYELARRDLDYFQAMLGYDARVRQVVELIGATAGRARRGRARPVATVPGGAGAGAGRTCPPAPRLGRDAAR